MALILDKTFTGITSTTVVTGFTEEYVETGYTETVNTPTGYIVTSYLGSGFTETTYVTGLTMLSYTDQYGNINQNPYLVIDKILIKKGGTDKGLPIIFTYLYKDKNARNSNSLPLVELNHTIRDNTIYDQYFSIAAMDGSNVFEKAYEYIITQYPGWKSDE